MRFNHIFGPVPSRRLGMSLGVDLVLHKICSMDCIYCECGETTQLTLDRREYVRFRDVKEELDRFLRHHPDPDYITFSGSGEPTLNPCMGEFIDYIRSIRPHVGIAVLTNSSLINYPDVKAALLKADLVLPSLDAVQEEAFLSINRPHPELEIGAIAKGIEDFAREFTGRIWLEVLILPGINDELSDLIALKEAIHRIRPEKLQLNTLDRPGTLSEITPASFEDLQWVERILDYPNTEIIAKAKGDIKTYFRQDDFKTALIETIRRRPCTKADLLKIFGTDEQLLDRHLKDLMRERKIVSMHGKRGSFYHTTRA